MESVEQLIKRETSKKTDIFDTSAGQAEKSENSRYVIPMTDFLTRVRALLADTREYMADHWFTDNPNGSDINEHIETRMRSLATACEMLTVMREALVRISEYESDDAMACVMIARDANETCDRKARRALPGALGAVSGGGRIRES